MTDEKLELVRTDSTTITNLFYKKKTGLKLTPLGRIRRIKRLNDYFGKNFKK